MKGLVVTGTDTDVGKTVFAAGLSQMETDIGAPMEDFASAMGTLPLPVQGWVLRQAGEADAAGIVRPGLVIATDPAALVTLPWPATIRYRGPLLDYGNVMIVEPASGYLLILAGLGTVFGETGDVLEAGAPVGFMEDARSTWSPGIPASPGAGSQIPPGLYSRDSSIHLRAHRDRSSPLAIPRPTH